MNFYENLILLLAIPAFTSSVLVFLFPSICKMLNPKLALFICVFLILLSFGVAEYIVFSRGSSEENIGWIFLIFEKLPILLFVITLLGFGIRNKIGLLASIVVLQTLALDWVERLIGYYGFPDFFTALAYILIVILVSLLVWKDLGKGDPFAWLLVGWNALVAIASVMFGVTTSPWFYIWEVVFTGNLFVPIFLASIYSRESTRIYFINKTVAEKYQAF